uniref:Phospholipase/carboxylesterase/thioesterase domain-containing protein n=1 Tax=Lactuca sativa TaxID=4236 RepID=A0A9R1X380_LACSA|nr:hypothetical protein LSAT_V11C800448500 [Lactuca sativa]
MIAHATELLTPGNIQVEILLKEERHNVQLLLYCKQNIEICRLYNLDSVSPNDMKLQQAHDEVRLNRNAQKLFDFVGKRKKHGRFKFWSQLLETLPLPNIKWICPTSPSQPLTLFGGFPTTAWFDVSDLSEDAHQDVESMDASAAHVLSLLSTEPPNIKLGVGGFSMGAATALYSATCFSHGKFGNGNSYSTHLDAIVGLSGWLPCAKDLSNKVEGEEAANRASSLPILLCHGKGKYFKNLII